MLPIRIIIIFSFWIFMFGSKLVVMPIFHLHLLLRCPFWGVEVPTLPGAAGVLATVLSISHLFVTLQAAHVTLQCTLVSGYKSLKIKSV